MRRIDRPDERSELERSLDAATHGTPSFAALYGRRQVGKSTLIHDFLGALPRSIDRVSFVATEEPTELVQLRRFADAARSSGIELRPTHWKDMLDQLASSVNERPLVLAIDEAPYLERATPGWPSIVQAWWDEVRRTEAPLLLVMTGSAIATMRGWLLSSGPLFQRVTTAIHLRPFSLPQCYEYLGTDPTTTIEARAVCGGFPGYLRLWDATRSTSENVKRLAFGDLAPLNFGGRRQLADAPSGGSYPSALRAIAQGRTAHNEISQAVGQRVDSLLEVLERAGFVRRVVPVTSRTWSKQSKYEFADPFTRFWFGFIFPEVELIEAGQGAAVWARARTEWNKHLGWVFENEAREHAIRLSASGYWGEPLLIGRYWSTRGPGVEIDVCGLRDRRTALVGGAKWSEQPIGLTQLERLRKRAALTHDPVNRPMLAYWARGAVTGDLRGTGDLQVFGPEDMVTSIRSE